MKPIIVTVELTTPQVKYLEFLENNEVTKEPEYISKKQAGFRFGEGNVNRWIRQRRVLQYKRPGIIQLSLRELREAAAERQDYLFP